MEMLAVQAKSRRNYCSICQHLFFFLNLHIGSLLGPWTGRDVSLLSADVRCLLQLSLEDTIRRPEGILVYPQACIEGRQCYLNNQKCLHVEHSEHWANEAVSNPDSRP